MEQYLGLVDDPYRRSIVQTLAERGTLEGGELVDAVAPAQVSRDTARVRLYHCHLPKLDGADVIRWDRDRMRVRPGENFEEVAGLIDAIAEAEPPRIPQ